MRRRTDLIARSDAVIAVALVAAIGGAVAAASSPCAPTGSAAFDRCLTGLFAGIVTLASAIAPLWALATAAGMLAVFGGSVALHLLGLAALGGAAAIASTGRPVPLARAVLGGTVLQGLLRLPWDTPARGSALVTGMSAAVILGGAFLKSPSRMRAIVVRAGAIAAVFIAIGCALALYAAVRSRSVLDAAQRDARAGVDAARAGDRERALAAFTRAQRDFDDAVDITGTWWTTPARGVPLVAQQMRALSTVASVGADALDVARSSVRDVNPDRLRLVDGRLDLPTVVSYRPVFDALARGTTAARTRLSRVSRVWLMDPLADRLSKFEQTLARADASAQTADAVIQLAPSLLGGSRSQTYLVLFVTPAEARGSGGFPANYGVLTATNGRVALTRLGRVDVLDREGAHAKRLHGLADYVRRYAKFDVPNTWENTTMSPDFPSVAKATAQLYPQSGGSRVDGVIRVDPFTLSRLLSLTGPVQVPGLPYPISAENAVPFLLRDQYALFSDNARRHDLLGAVGRATFDRFTSGRAARPNVIADALSPAVRGTNLAMWFRDADAQRLVARLGADAALPPLRGDELGVVTQNGGGSKIDFYLRRAVDYTARIDPDTGAIHSRVRIALRNATPVCGSASRRNLNSCDGVSFYVFGNGLGLPVGTNRSYVSVYSPFLLRRATLDGRPWQPVAERELGRNVYSQFVDIAAGATRTIELELEGGVELSAGSYRFRYFSQVLAHPDAVQATVVVAAGAHIGRTNARPPVRITVGQRRGRAVAATATGGPWEVEVALRR